MTRYYIDGPIPVHIEAAADGVAIDVSRYLTRAVFAELFQAASEDPEGFAEEFADMAELSRSAQHQGADGHARHEFDERMDKLLAEFADEGRIRLYATGVRQLRDALVEIAAPRPVPGQREGGAAA